MHWKLMDVIEVLDEEKKGILHNKNQSTFDVLLQVITVICCYQQESSYFYIVLSSVYKIH